MSVCLSCGKETEECLCEECKQKIDIENLCGEIRVYTPKETEDKNPIWEEVASKMEDSNNFRNLAFALADYLPSPRKEYQQIFTIVEKNWIVPRDSKPWFSKLYEQIIETDNLEKEEKLLLKGLMLETLYQDYRYPEADGLAYELLNQSDLPWQSRYFIADFFSKTRRYDEADDAISVGTKSNIGNEDALKKFAELSGQNENRKNAPGNGKKEYLPTPKEGKEKYTEFMTSLGIDTSAVPVPIPEADYPMPVEKREDDFDSFVAFDFETTGTISTRDAIIEVGAIRVVNGEVVETAEFTFQEFVKPFKRSVSDKITELTGISKEDVKDARKMWEVIPDFMKFVGDDILVGFNSIAFDSKLLRRAGRYSHEIYTNKHFDVLRYLNSIKDEINYKGENEKLDTVGKTLGIENPQAHRALSDAITTAKVYLKLKEMRNNSREQDSIESILDLGEL